MTSIRIYSHRFSSIDLDSNCIFEQSISLASLDLWLSIDQMLKINRWQSIDWYWLTSIETDDRLWSIANTWFTSHGGSGEVDVWLPNSLYFRWRMESVYGSSLSLSKSKNKQGNCPKSKSQLAFGKPALQFYTTSLLLVYKLVVENYKISKWCKKITWW